MGKRGIGCLRCESEEVEITEFKDYTYYRCKNCDTGWREPKNETVQKTSKKI